MKPNQFLFLFFVVPLFVHSQSIDLENFGKGRAFKIGGGVSANSGFYSSEAKYYLNDIDEEIAEDEIQLAESFYRNKEIGENSLGEIPDELKNKHYNQLVKKGEILAEAKWTQFEEEFGDLLGEAKEAFKADFANSPKLLDEFTENPELVDAWKRLADLGRNQMRKDPSILASMRKAMVNPNLPSNRLDDILNSLAESGAKCKTCDNVGRVGLRYIDEVLDDLDGFAKDFKNTPGYDDFLREMGEQGKKATGGSWTLEALMKNRSKYLNGETITGFEVKHFPGRKFAADVVTDVGGVPHYKEFKSWSSNLMGQSNMIDQMTGTMSVINNLDEMKFIFNPSRWKPTASQFKTALQGKKSLIEAVSNTKKTQLFGTTNADEIIDILSSDEVFETIIKVQ